MTLFTALLNTFYKDGGFDALLNICRHFITVVEEFSSIAQDTRTAEQSTELASAYGGLKIALLATCGVHQTGVRVSTNRSAHLTR